MTRGADAAIAAPEPSTRHEAIVMYDTNISALRTHQERSVHAWMRAAAYAAGTEPEDEYIGATSLHLAEVDLGEAVESKKRDNLVLGEALVSIG
jgi:hypothetical protein